MAKITWEDGVYVFSHFDEIWSVVTDWRDIEELQRNIEEALELHFGDSNYKIELDKPKHLIFANKKYATHL